MSEKYILVVDDDPSVGILFEMALRPLGIEMKAAFDGCEAMEMIENRLPAVILLDLMMPCLDGYEVLGRLENNPATAKIPVIVFSAAIAPLGPGGRDWPAQVIEVMEKGSTRPSAIRVFIENLLLTVA